MNNVGSYVPSQVSVSLFGVTIDGFSPTNIVTIDKEEATYTVEMAMDGSVTASLDKFAPYRVTMFLQSTSSANTWLHLVYKLFERYGAEFKMPLYIRDRSGDTSFFCTDVLFETVPSRELSNEITIVEWSFLCFAPNFKHGSNEDPNTIITTLNMLQSALTVASMFGVDLSSFSGQIKEYADNGVAQLKEMF